MGNVNRYGAVIHNRVVVDGEEVARDVAITYPDITPLTVDIQAMGTISMPVPGLFEAFELGFTKEGFDLVFGKITTFEAHKVEIYEVASVFGADQTYSETFTKTYATGIPGSLPGGSSEVGSKRTLDYKFAPWTYQQYIDGEEICNIDRFNQVCVINGKDLYENIRSQMG